MKWVASKDGSRRDTATVPDDKPVALQATWVPFVTGGRGAESLTLAPLAPAAATLFVVALFVVLFGTPVSPSGLAFA